MSDDLKEELRLLAAKASNLCYDAEHIIRPPWKHIDELKLGLWDIERRLRTLSDGGDK